jgi:hypothetical protein
LSISAYHEESWQPAWGVRTMLEAIISFLPSEGAGAIGALDWTAEERKKLAKQSLLYHCPTCGPIKNLLKEASEMTEGDSKPDSSMAEQVAQLHLGPPAASSTSPKYNSSAVPNELLMASAAAQMSSSLSSGQDGPDNGLGHGPADQQNHLHSPMTTEGAHLLDHHSPKALVTEDAVDNFDHLQQIDKIHGSLKKSSPGGETTAKEGREEKEGTEVTNEKSNSSSKTTEPTDSMNNNSSNDLKKEGNTIPAEKSVPNTTTASSPATTTGPPPSLTINPPPTTTSSTPPTQPNNNNNNNNSNSNPPPLAAVAPAPLGAAIAAAAAAQQQEARAAVVVDRLRRTEEFLSTMILVTMVGIFAILAKVVMRNILKFDH